MRTSGVETTASPNGAKRYVSFRLARQDYLIDAARVHGVVPARDVSGIAHPLSCVRGRTYVLGREVLVVDVRARLGLPEQSLGKHPFVLIVEVQSESSAGQIGIIVEKTADVLTLREDDFRNGLVRISGRPKRLLSLENLLAPEELRSLMPTRRAS